MRRPHTVSPSLRAALTAVAFAVVASCGGGVIPKVTGKAQGSVAGLAIKGPVAAGAVHVFKVSAALERGDELGSGTTDADGAFEVKLPPYNGPLLVTVSSGTYTEEAIGLGVKLDGTELAQLLPGYTGGAVVTGLRLTPVSTLAVAFTTFHVASGQPLADAHAEAMVHLNKHFGDIDWTQVTPADLTVAGVTNLSPEARAGLLLSGLSWQSKLQAESSSVTPGLVVNAATLMGALVRDASDGTFDGHAATEVLKQARAVLTGGTLRADLVAAMSGFIGSPRNASALKLQDVTSLLAAVGTNADPYLFCPAQVASAGCGSGPVDTEPPVITWVRPADGAGVAGSAQVEVQATDDVKLATLHFTAPSSLGDAMPVISADGHQGTLTATLDVSALPDGPVTVRAEASDASGNPAVKSITLVVSNKGPRVTVSTPGDGAVVRGTLTISASAQAQAPGATIAKLELVDPPPGVGPDTLPAADSFAASWSTTAAPEGLTTLRLKATDSFGTATELSVAVTVDNIPFGQVSAVVTAGAPVPGLTVKLVAIDDATGLPVVGRAGGAVLGQSSAVTDGDGGVTFVLTGENYEGPVQVVATGISAGYLDPSDGTTTISLPSTFSFTSYQAHYRTGDMLSVPVDYWTTLADAAALAYAQGHNPSQPTPGTLSNALRATEPLFPAHLSRPQAWGLRVVFPVSLTGLPQSLRDVVYAAAADVALNQLARDIAVDVGLTPGTGYAAPQLVDALRQDLSDGQFDGLAGTMPLVTGGTAPYSLDANTTRFKLAVGLDRFVRGAQNRTGLTRQDMQTSNVYDNMAGDISLLYPASAQPIPFDNQPPVVTWSATFANGGQSGLQPVGTLKLVGGLLTIHADAVDASGVASLVVSINGVAVMPGTGSTPAHFVGALDTTTQPDGPLTITSQACDRLANCGPSVLQLEVDNAPPAVTPVRPTAGFYSASFDVEALASDNYRVETFTVAGIAGLVDQDTAVNRVYAPATSWVLPAALVDGPVTLTFRACDQTKNCATATLISNIDRTPPTLTVRGSPPQYTNIPVLVLGVDVSDGTGAGVARVLASVNGAPSVVGVQAGSTWAFSNLRLLPGSNAITLWAEDAAVPTNPGQGRGAPYSRTVTVLLDTVAPAVNVVPLVSYQVETGLNFARNPDGSPVMPVQYQYSAPAKVDLAPDAAQIYKAATRLSWGPATPTGAELEAANARNVPFIQVAVPFTAASDSPIASATVSWIVSGCATCGGGSLATPTTSLIPAGRTAPGFVYFDLPIALETIPQLQQPAGGTLRIYPNVVVTDAAGNAGNAYFVSPRTVNVLPPPIALVRDQGYHLRGDSQSLYAYRLANQTYPSLFDPNNPQFTADNTLRHSRWVAFNPADVPVAFDARAFGAAYPVTIKEGWGSTAYVLPGVYSDTYTLDGFTFRIGPYWDSRPGSNFATDCALPAFNAPCGPGTRDTLYPTHIVGQTGAGFDYACRAFPAPPLGPPIPPTYTAGTMPYSYTFRVFKNAVLAPTGVESVAADPLTGVIGAYIIPQASGTTAGTVAVYAGGPRPTTRGARLLAWQSNPYDATSRYQYWYADFWVPTGIDGYSCNASRPDLITEVYSAHRWYEYLGLAQTTTTGISVAVRTAGAQLSGTTYTQVGSLLDYTTSNYSFTFNH